MRARLAARGAGAYMALLLAGGTGIVGCGRHVVLAPDEVARGNDRDWRIHWAQPAPPRPAAAAASAKAPNSESTESVPTPTAKPKAKP